MRVYVCVGLVLVAMGCAGNDRKPDPGAADASAVRPALATLTATSAQLATRFEASAPSRNHVFVQVALSLKNLDELVPLSASPVAFALETPDLLLYRGRMLPSRAVATCDAGVEVARGGTLACSLPFELP